MKGTVDGWTARLKNIKKVENAADILWDLLAERTAEQSVSHTTMPEREAHSAFVAKPPYRAWYIIIASGLDPDQQDVGRVDLPVGAIYLTRRNEIGVGVFQKYQRKGFATWAIQEVMRQWGHALVIAPTHHHLGREFYANVNPGNAASIALFEKLGFNVRQLTLARKVELEDTGNPLQGMRMVETPPEEEHLE